MLQFNHFKGRCKPMDKRTSTNGNKVLGYIAKRIAVRDANTTCPFLGYQICQIQHQQRKYMEICGIQGSGCLWSVCDHYGFGKPSVCCVYTVKDTLDFRGITGCFFYGRNVRFPDCRKTLLALCFFVRIANGDVCRDLVIGGFISVYVCF